MTPLKLNEKYARLGRPLNFKIKKIEALNRGPLKSVRKYNKLSNLLSNHNNSTYAIYTILKDYRRRVAKSTTPKSTKNRK